LVLQLTPFFFNARPKIKQMNGNIDNEYVGQNVIAGAGIATGVASGAADTFVQHRTRHQANKRVETRLTAHINFDF
jgi:acyl CoA:acetate/3-ketoacid CoA transferase beta subunit